MRRSALLEKPAESWYTCAPSERRTKVLCLCVYTFFSVSLHIVGLLLILGSNLWIFLAILVGDVWGVYMSMMIQQQDTPSSLEPRLLQMFNDYTMAYESKEKGMVLSVSQEKEMSEMKTLRDYLIKWLKTTETSEAPDAEGYTLLW
jgi:hypothetical protein